MKIYLINTMNNEQIEKFKNIAIEKGFTENEINLFLNKKIKTEEPGYFKRVGESFGESVEDIKSAILRPALSRQAGAPPLEITKQLGETGLRTAGEVASMAFAPIGEAISPVVKPLIQKIISLPGMEDKVQDIVKWANENPDAAKNLEAILNIAMLKGTKMATGITLKAGGTGLKTTGIAGKSIGERLYRIAAPMEQSTARAVQAYQAAKPTLIERIGGFLSKTPKEKFIRPIRESETAARFGLAGTEWKLGVQAKRAMGDLWNKIIAPALESSKESINMKEFFVALQKRIIQETPDLSRRHLLLKAFQAFQNDFKNVSSISLRKLQDYKSGWTKYIPERVYRGKPITGALNEIRNMAAQEARAKIYNTLGGKLKQAYMDYGNLESIMEAGLKSVDPLRSRSAFRQAWEFVVDKGITPISSYGGKIIYKTSEGIEFIGEKGLKKVGDILMK